MPSASITIELGNNFDYSGVIGKHIEYQNADARIQNSKNGFTAHFTASDHKALFTSMGSVVRQLTVVDSVVRMLDVQKRKEALNSNRAKTHK